ncbi:MAG TPA: low affinity iron permease family protein [Methylotenera sp.]|nr:low affinity iron permease family protein [Methylotenera sp.]
MNVKDGFRNFASKAVFAVSSVWSFIVFFILICSWLIIGVNDEFSDHWKLILDITLTIVTFLIVLLIQHTQLRENRLTQLKLDELLKGVEGSRTEFIGLEEQTDHKLDEIQGEFQDLIKPDVEELTGKNPK